MGLNLRLDGGFAPVVAWLVGGVLCALSTLAGAGTFSGLCIGVPDGDTIVVRDGKRRRFEVRLQGIDAPEKGQRFGSLARRNLTSLVYRKPVEVDWNKQDKYGRLVGRVYVGDIDVNLSQADAGMAWAYRQYLDEMSARDQRLFLEAEKGARAEGRGLWRDTSPTPPWEWRHRRERSGAPGRAESAFVQTVSCSAAEWERAWRLRLAPRAPYARGAASRRAAGTRGRPTPPAARSAPRSAGATAPPPPPAA